MYQLVFGRPDFYRVLKQGSLMECLGARFVSGDLILNPQGHVVQGVGWLFPWERLNPNCYARRMQKRWTH